jgi:hypothetical protein
MTNFEASVFVDERHLNLEPLTPTQIAEVA